MVHIERWQPSRTRSFLEAMAYPLAYALNRPRFRGAGQLLLELALRCNGIGVSRPGRQGLTAAEESFLQGAASRFGEGVVLDVGANVGAFAALVRRLAPKAAVTAFEPHPRTFSHLATTAARSGFEAVNAALSDSAGTTVLHDFADADGSTQASLDPEAVTLHGGGKVVTHEVQCLTLDLLAEQRGWDRIAFLKIDTEGFDLNVLRGARRLLAEQRIAIIQFEFIPSNIVRKVTMMDFFDVLEGYAINRLCLNGALLPLTPYSVKHCEIFAVQNLIALPA
jgi:FkbM family methyltransferase